MKLTQLEKARRATRLAELELRIAAQDATGAVRERLLVLIAEQAAVARRVEMLAGMIGSPLLGAWLKKTL